MTSAANAKGQRGLTDLQTRFADMWAEALAAGVTFTNAEIAEAAGYSGAKPVLEVTASRTLSNPAVREYLHSKAKHYLREGAFEAAVTLRKLSTKAVSERVRADVASRLAVGLGLIEGEGGNQGPGVVVQILFRHSDGTLLAQPEARTTQRPVIEHESDAAHSLAEGEGGAAGVPEGGGEGVERAPAKAPRPRKTARQSPPPGQPHDLPPKKSRGAKERRERGGGGAEGLEAGQPTVKATDAPGARMCRPPKNSGSRKGRG